jgi:hypothetical protein
MERKILKPLRFQYALVIEETEFVRTSMVNALRAQGWFVHGVRRAEGANGPRITGSRRLCRGAGDNFGLRYAF